MTTKHEKFVLDLIIDSREDKLIKMLEADILKKECGHVEFDIEQLDVGDIIFRHKGQIICAIERKTYEDYASSITDGRSKNQTIRISQLKKDNPDVLIIYLIEGTPLHKDHRFRNGITRDSLYSSLINKLVRDKFTVFHSANITDTALIVVKLYDKLLEHHSKNDKKIDTDERLDYLKTIKLAKKENLTPTNCYLCQLSQIPGSSIDIANLIAKQYSSMRLLILAYEYLTTLKAKEDLLAEIEIPIANNKTKRLGNVLSGRIYHYLCDTPISTLEPTKLKIKLKT